MIQPQNVLIFFLFKICSRTSSLFAVCSISMRVFKRPFVFYSKIRSFTVVTKQPFILWWRNMELFPKSHSLFENNLKNLKLQPNDICFFDREIQNLKLYSNSCLFFWLEMRRLELKSFIFPWTFNNLKTRLRAHLSQNVFENTKKDSFLLF